MSHKTKSRNRVLGKLTSGLATAGLLASGFIGLSGINEAQAVDPLPYQDISLPFSVRAADLVSRMSQEEKAQQFFTGIFNATAANAGNSNAQAPAIPRLGVASYNYWNEALHGVARRNTATEFPTGLGIASTWDRDLVYNTTEAISDEARDKTNDCLAYAKTLPATGGLTAVEASLNYWCEGLTYWSPTINLARDPRWGRADESYGEDPYIAGEIAGQFAQGLQGGRNQSLPDSVGGTATSYLKAIATPKHFLANNSEVNRHDGTSNLTDRSLHEYYTSQFGKAAGAEYGAKSFMTSYNSVNINPDYTSKWGQPTVDTVVNDKGGTPVPANKYAVETLMRRLYGFDGFVTSDCGAIQDTWEVAPAGHSWTPTELGRQVTEAEGDAYSLKAGTDMDCTVGWNSGALTATYPLGLPIAQATGLATEQDWDIALTRAFTIRFQTGEFDDDAVVPYRSSKYTQTDNGQEEAVGSNEHEALAHQMSLEAPVLLKNTGNVLPLKHTPGKKTVVLGYYSTHPIHGGYSPAATTVPTVSAADAIKSVVGAADTVINDQAIIGAIGTKPSVSRLEAWAAGKVIPPTGNGSNPNTATAYAASTTFKPDNNGWGIKSSFTGTPSFYARDGFTGYFDVENFTIPAGTDRLRLNIAGNEVIDPLTPGDPNCESAAGPTTGCPTIGSFEVTIGSQSRTYSVNRQKYTNLTTSAVSETYLPIVIPLSDFSGVSAGDTVTVRFEFSTSGAGAGAAPGINLSAAQRAEIAAAENVVVYVGTRESDSNEEADRVAIDLPRWQADLAALAISLNPNTVVYIQSVGQVDITKFKNAAKGIIWTTYNGQYQGNAAAELLFGQTVTLEDGRQIKANPSGKLTYTYYSDVDTQLGLTDEGYSMDYSLTTAEGSRCGRTYWYYQAGKPGCAAPDFVFGYGLSYTSFGFSNVSLSATSVTPNDTIEAEVTVKNTGSLAGRTTAQLYASAPNADGVSRPFKQLKGFVKTGVLEPGAVTTLKIPLKVADLWFWDTDSQKRVYDTGAWKILVGPSSADNAALTKTLNVSGTRTAGVDVVKALPDGVTLNLATPENVINSNLSVTKNDQSFYELTDPALKISYASANPAVAKVDSNGVVTAVGVGATLITATATADDETGKSTYPVVVHNGVPAAGATLWSSPPHITALFPALPAQTAFDYVVSFTNSQATLAQAKAGVQLKASTTAASATYEYVIAPMDLNEISGSVTPDGVLKASKAGQVQVTVVANVGGVKISRHALVTVTATDQSALDAAVAAADAERKALDTAKLTPETVKAYDDAIAKAKLVLANPSSTQAEVEAAIAAIAGAKAALKGIETAPEPISVATAKVANKVWTGKKISSGFKVTVNGKALVVNKDYKIVSTGANKSIGKASVKISGLGTYFGEKDVSFKIVPKAVKVSKATAAKKKVTVKWAKATTAQKVTGYQVSYKVKGTSKWTTKTVKGATKASLAVKKLKKGKAYQVKVRVYKTVSGTKYYSAYSAVKTSAKVK